MRAFRAVGVALFVFLVLLVSVERRLADAQFNRQTAAPALESDDILDGDELRVRLIVLNDDNAPRLPAVVRTLVLARLHAHAEHCVFLALGRPAPRGPPPLSAA